MSKKDLKIACVGNMNNTMFAVTRHLRHLGYNAELILSNEFSHFNPAADTFEKANTSYIKELDFLKTDILYTDRLRVHNFFFNYDVIIACGYSVGYLTFSKVKIDIVIPYGSDLYDLPFFDQPDPNNDYFNKQRAALAKYQKKGIEEADAILFDYTNEDFEQVFKKFNLKGKLYRYACPFIYTPEFNFQNSNYIQGKCKYAEKMREIKTNFDFIALSHIRQSWKNPLDIWSYKGNERIFKAFTSFLKEKNIKACLIVFEYGNDLEESKKLVKELGIEKNVIWFPVSERKEILSMISFVDIGIGEIGDYSWFSYGAIFEFLCMKKPVIHHRNDNLYIKKVESLYPMYSANNEETLLLALKDCYNDPVKKNEIAERSYEWYQKNAIDKPLEILRKTISAKNITVSKINKSFDRFFLTANSLLFFIRLKLK